MRYAFAFIAALFLAACAGGGGDPPGEERFPTSEDYPPGVMERVDFTAGVPEGWRLSSLQSGARPEATWRIVVISGTPSWSEYWAPTIAALPPNREMIVIDRPGFSASEPEGPVLDLQKQADAMAPALATPGGRPVLLVGQSFGAPIAAIMAAEHPDKVRALVLASSYFGVRGRTARRLMTAGSIVRPLLPHDLRNSVAEMNGQSRQLPQAWAALESLRMPVAFVHGDQDTFVPEDAAIGFARTYGAEFIPVPGGDHFLNACCVRALIASFEAAIARAEAAGGPPARAAAP